MKTTHFLQMGDDIEEDDKLNEVVIQVDPETCSSPGGRALVVLQLLRMLIMSEPAPDGLKTEDIIDYDIFLSSLIVAQLAAKHRGFTHEESRKIIAMAQAYARKILEQMPLDELFPSMDSVDGTEVH